MGSEANAGVIFGTVSSSVDGKSIANATIALNYISGDASLAALNIGRSNDLKCFIPNVTTGSDGRFVLPFAWSQTEIGKLAGQGYGKASIYVGIWTDQGHTYTNQWCNVYLMLDIRYLIAFGYTPLSMSVPDAASIGKDFFAAFKDMLPAHGVFYPSALILSTDVYGLAGRVSVGIAPPA